LTPFTERRLGNEPPPFFAGWQRVGRLAWHRGCYSRALRKEITTACVIAGAAGGAVAIALMEVLSEQASFPLIMVPFATSIVLVMGTPDAEPAQPRAHWWAAT
jgi:hypothetical protein